MNLSPLHERMQAAVGRRTFRAVAEAMDHNHETTRRYLQGHAPSVEFLVKLCAVFQINAHWLLTGQGEMRLSEDRARVLRESGPADLMTAIASMLERLTERVDRIETYVQTLEARLRAIPAVDGAVVVREVDAAQSVSHGRGRKGAVKGTDAATEATGSSGSGGGGGGKERRVDHAPPARLHGEPADDGAAGRARRIADAVAQRPREDAD